MITTHQPPALDNVCKEAHNVFGPSSTTLRDDRELQAREGTRRSKRVKSILIPWDLRKGQDVPARIMAPADPSKITPEEKEEVDKILGRLKASIGVSGSKDQRRRQFSRITSRLRGLGYDVEYEKMEGFHRITIPPDLRNLLPDLPERITVPADRSKIAPEDHQRIYVILQELKSSVEGCSSKDRSKLRAQFRNFKACLKRDLGYEVDFPNTARKITSSSQSSVHPSKEHTGETSVTSFEQVAQTEPSGGQTWMVPSPPVQAPPSTQPGVNTVEVLPPINEILSFPAFSLPHASSSHRLDNDSKHPNGVPKRWGPYP
ncbi:hypothetical protein H0H93_008244 [Arthromyces matolae]|nr:hypothetical protein H0H93_008244 [Arthromyces matolae]